MNHQNMSILNLVLQASWVVQLVMLLLLATLLLAACGTTRTPAAAPLTGAQQRVYEHGQRQGRAQPLGFARLPPLRTDRFVPLRPASPQGELF